MPVAIHSLAHLKFLRRQQKKRFRAILFRLENRARTHQQNAGDNDDRCTETLVLCTEERTRESQGSGSLAATTPCPAGIRHVDHLTTLSPVIPVALENPKNHRRAFALLIPGR